SFGGVQLPTVALPPPLPAAVPPLPPTGPPLLPATLPPLLALVPPVLGEPPLPTLPPVVEPATPPSIGSDFDGPQPAINRAAKPQHALARFIGTFLVTREKNHTGSPRDGLIHSADL